MPLAPLRLLALLAALAGASLAAAQTASPGDALQDANQLFKQGQHERALERLEVFLKSRPKDARGRFLKGLILAEQNKPDDAIKVFTELTHEFPELPEPYNNLAVLYASQGQYDKARSALEMAIRTHPSYATAHENLGDIYAKMASQAYDKALQLDKSNTNAQTKLNLIKDIFPASPRLPKAAATRPDAARVAVATPAQKPTPPAAPPQARTPAPVAKAPVPAARTQTPVAKSAPIKPAVPPATNPDEVVSTLNQWARAWSENDIAGYLAHYSTDFKTPKGETRVAWEAQRKARIAKPRKIKVDVESPKVVFNSNGRVTVTFRQHYRSDALNVSSTKTLVMVKAGDRWLIQQERVGS